MPPAARRLVLRHDYLARPEQVGTAAKKTPRAQEQDRPEVQEQRREFREELAGMDPQWLVSVDEGRVNTAMARTSGRASVRRRVYANTPGQWKSITLTCGMRLSGVMAAMAFPGATDTAAFETYVKEVSVPEL